MMPYAGLIKTIIWRTGLRQTILITVTFATKPRGLVPKKAEVQEGDNKEMEGKWKKMKWQTCEGQIIDGQD